MSEMTHNHKLCHYSAHLPGVILAGAFFGLVIHLILPIQLGNNEILSFIGTLFLMIAPLLIMWSQKKRREVYGAKAPELSLQDLSRGPYAYSRHPSHLGLFFLVIGFAFILNSLFVLLGILVIFLAFNFVIIPKEESLLEAHVGETYRAYKNKVRMWI